MSNKRVLYLALICATLLQISACAVIEVKAIESRLIGKWTSESVTKDRIAIHMDVEYFEDGSCKTEITYFGPYGQSKSYSLLEAWNLNDKTITYTVIGGSDPSLIGGSSSVVVISHD